MAAPTPRKTAPRKTSTTRRRPAAKPAAELGLVLDDAAARATTDKLVADREPLFTIGQTTHTIPRKVPPSWTLKAYTLAATEGESAALTFAAQKLLTEDAWNALVECDTLTEDGMRAVLKALMDRILPDGVIGPKA